MSNDEKNKVALLAQGDFLISSSIPLKTVFFSSSLAIVFSEKGSQRFGMGLFSIPDIEIFNTNLFLSVNHGLWLSYLNYIREVKNKDNISISVFGASNIIGKAHENSGYGFKNLLFFDKIVQELNVNRLFNDLGGNFCRQLELFPGEKHLFVNNSLAERINYDF